LESNYTSQLIYDTTGEKKEHAVTGYLFS
jgi:hypothetical protein